MVVKISATLAVAFLALVAALATWNDLLLYYAIGPTLIALSAAVGLMLILTSKPRVILGLLRFAPLVWIGRVSYGLYLWHWPVRWFVYRQQILPDSLSQLLIAVTLSFTFTAFSYYLIEKRFLRLKNRATSRANLVQQ